MQYELERKRHEQELREREQYMSALVETAPECIKTLDEDGTMLQVNPAGVQLLEADAEADVVGTSIYDFVASEHRESFRQFNERICSGESGTFEYDVVGLEGTRRNMETHAAPLCHPDGSTSHVALTRDVTEQKERGVVLEKTVDQLQQSNDRLTQFAYAASHDLQEPLRMVSSYVRLLEDRYADELDEEAGEYIDFAVDGADRMRDMVDDLLAYSRVEQSDGTFESVDCGAVLDRVVGDLQVQVEETDADVDVADLPTVQADPDQLEQLFRNLVSNAVKYSGDDPPRVEVTAERCQDAWALSVADDGIGIDPEYNDRIFEVFKRLHHSDEYSGTGIGLSLCQEIVENHDGDIRVDSEPGEGSTFVVTLPDHEPTA
ncbi:histidine kinase [Halobacterium sp. DL1]|nr:histidine kinase [Halobacterium sp. DL1]